MPGPLTTTERRQAIDSLGMSQRYFADLIGLSESNVRRWFRDPNAEVPPEVDAWLYLIVNNPPPFYGQVKD